MTTYTKELDKQIDNTREHADAIRATNPQRATYEDGFADGLARAYRMVAEQENRITELESALGPFANAAKVIHPAIDDRDGLWTASSNGVHTKITAGDCRRARALLETK